MRRKRRMERQKGTDADRRAPPRLSHDTLLREAEAERLSRPPAPLEGEAAAQIPGPHSCACDTGNLVLVAQGTDRPFRRGGAVVAPHAEFQTDVDARASFGLPGIRSHQRAEARRGPDADDADTRAAGSRHLLSDQLHIARRGRGFEEISACANDIGSDRRWSGLSQVNHCRAKRNSCGSIGGRDVQTKCLHPII